MKRLALTLATTMLLSLSASAGGASAASGANAVLHVHRIVVVQPPTLPSHMSLLVQLGDAGPAGVHGVQTVQVHFGSVTFSAGRADVTRAQYTLGPWGQVSVFLAGRFERVQGGGLHAGDTWSILIHYEPSHGALKAYNTVDVRTWNGQRPGMAERFLGPYISLK